MHLSFFRFFSSLAIIQVYCVYFSFFTFFSVSSHILGPTVCVFHFTCFWVFLAVFQVKQCLCLIFHIFQFSRHNAGLLCVFLIFYVFSVSSSIVGCTVFVSHFARFSVIFAIFQALPCEFLIFLLCQVLLDIFQVLQCLCSIFHFFQWFLPYSRSYHISFSFSSFDIFLAIFQVLKWVCIPFHVFQFFQHILVPVMWISLFFFHFPVLSPYSRSYSVHFLFSTLFSFSRHIPGLTVCISF